MFFRKNLCRDAEAIYLALMQISHMAHVTERLVTEAGIKFSSFYNSQNERLIFYHTPRPGQRLNLPPQ